MFDLEAFGNRIKEKRIALGLTQYELAKKAGYSSRSTINKIEQGIIDPPLSKLMIFAEALQTSAVYLMGIEAVQPSDSTKISYHELNLLNVYQEHPEMQPMIDKLLNIELDGYVNVYTAAHSTDRHRDRIVRMSVEDVERIENAPESDDPLM